jgi:hypothetical protein
LVMAPCFATTAYLLDSSRPTGNLIILDPDLRSAGSGGRQALTTASVMRWTSPVSGMAVPYDGQDVFSSGRLCDVGGIHRS